MDIDKEFSAVIEKLKNNERPLLKYTQEQFEEINSIWTELLKDSNTDELIKVYCVLDNTQNYSNIFEKNIYDVFNSSLSDQIFIYNLSASSKHIINYYHKKGERVPFTLLEELKKLLTHKNPEVLEWTLRTIEQLGSQAIFLKDDIINNKPGMLSLFDKHKKASKQIIEMLEKRWSPRP